MKSTPKTPQKSRLSSDSKRDSIWAEKKLLAKQVDEMAGVAGLKKLESSMRECAIWLSFQLEAQASKSESENPQKPKYKLRGMHSCKKRHCPICTWRRSLMWKAKLLKAVPKIAESHKNYRYLLLTLTVPNCEISDLRETLRQMNLAWKRMIKLADFKIIKGFIKATEVTKGKAGTAHPHYHILLLVPPSYFSKYYVKRARWLEMWQESMRNNLITQVDIRPIKSIETGCAEVLKYATKSADLVGEGVHDLPSVAWFREYVKQVHKLHFVSSGGLLKDVLKDEDIEADLIHVEEEKESENNEILEMRHYQFIRKENDYFRGRYK